MGLGSNRSGGWRGVALTLAAMAVVLKVLIPSGYMVDTRPGAPAGLVICTGHGALVLGGKDGSKAPAQKSSDAPCAFSGVAAPPLLPTLVAAIAEPHVFVIQPSDGPQPADLSPGRGLAAPPPPALGPPQVSI